MFSLLLPQPFYHCWHTSAHGVFSSRKQKEGEQVSPGKKFGIETSLLKPSCQKSDIMTGFLKLHIGVNMFLHINYSKVFSQIQRKYCSPQHISVMSYP